MTVTIVTVKNSNDSLDPLAVRILSGYQEAVNKMSRKKQFLPKHIFSSQQTKILTLTQKVPKMKTSKSFRVAVKRLSGSCQEAVRRLSGKNHHNFETKIKFGLWCRYHRRACPTPSVLTRGQVTFIQCAES